MAEALRRLRTLLLVAGVVAAASPAPGFSQSPAEFLADKPAELAALVRIAEVETRWVIIEHGDHVPVLRVQSTVVRPIVGPSLQRGDRLATMHFDYSDMIFEEISPPPVIGHEYLVLADPVPAAGWEWLAPVEVDWVAHAQGVHRLRGTGAKRFVFWQGRRHPLTDLEALLGSGDPIPLRLIADPETRLRVAQQRFETSRLGDPAEFADGLITLVRPRAEEAETPGQSSFQLWYEGLSLLRRLGHEQAHHEVVVAALGPLLIEVGDHRRLVVALLLAELGDGSGRDALEAALQAADVELNRDPDSDLILPGRLPYDDSSVAAAAHALGALGSRQGLGHPEVEVRLAAADGLGPTGGEEVLAALRPIARELDEAVRALEEEGKLTAARDPGDYRQRYPHQWVKVHQLLARLGDDDSLERLVVANRTDRLTYPEREPTVHPRLEVATWTTAPHRWPDLGAALASADADPARLLDRLESVYGESAGWRDAVLLSVRALVEGEPAGGEPPDPEEERKETLRRIAELVSSDTPEGRAEGLAGAGFHQVEEHFQEVLATALEGSGIERQAAIYGLGFYGRELAAADLRRLCREGSLSSRLSGLELATRRQPQRFAGEAMAVLNDLLAENQDGAAVMEEYERRSAMRQFPRLLARFSRGEIPAPILAGLETGNEAVRQAVATGLGLGGNPGAGPALRAAGEDAGGELGQTLRWALERLGPEE